MFRASSGCFPGGSKVKASACNAGTRVRSLSREDPLEKEMATHSSILTWRIPWREDPGRLQSMGSQRVGQDWATSLTHSLGVWTVYLYFFQACQEIVICIRSERVICIRFEKVIFMICDRVICISTDRVLCIRSERHCCKHSESFAFVPEFSFCFYWFLHPIVVSYSYSFAHY